jgi:hypothetical protein
MKNLVILHLESISRQRLAGFGSAFPNVCRLMREALVFDNFFSSATSTLMVVSYLFCANDFEFDTVTEFEGMRPQQNNRNLFSVLQGRGYHANLICLNAFHATHPATLRAWSDDLPPVWGTNDFPSLFARFDELTDTQPFAIYVCDLVTHIDHSLALAPYSSGLTDQIRRACAVADDAVGEMLSMLERKGLLDNTTFVVYGDHGDDFWTHGFKEGMVHATEPYTGITWTPLAIRDPDLAAGANDNLASTIDIGPTCLALLGIDEPTAFPHSGTNLLEGIRDHVFSQNFNANQPDNTALGIAQAFAVIDKTYALLASSRGLELYAYRLDPGNHCNLLHFFDLAPDGRLAFRSRPAAAAHYRSALQDNARAVAHLTEAFGALRNALAARVAAKRAYIVDRGVDPTNTLDPRCLGTINEETRAAFFRRVGATLPARAPLPSFEFSYKLTPK